MRGLGAAPEGALGREGFCEGSLTGLGGFEALFRFLTGFEVVKWFLVLEKGQLQWEGVLSQLYHLFGGQILRWGSHKRSYQRVD